MRRPDDRPPSAAEPASPRGGRRRFIEAWQARAGNINGRMIVVLLVSFSLAFIGLMLLVLAFWRDAPPA